MEDIHPITFAQLNELSKNPKFFALNLRVSKKKDMHTVMNENVTFVAERFPALLVKSLPDEQYERIWVCGPPPMNEDMINLFDKLEIPPEKYLMM